MAIGDLVQESREITFPNQFDVTDWPISLLCNDDFRLACVLLGICTTVIVPLAVNEHDHVGVLFDRP